MSEDNRVDLYMLDLATNAKTRLTNDQHVESSPCWSPNGEEVCFVSDKLGVPQIYLMSASGGAARRLSVGGNECVSPDWSRVTNRLCYSKRSNTGQYVIEVMDMGKGGGAPEAVTVAAGDWEAPSWAPDGRHLVCTRRSGRSRDLYMVDTWLKAFWPITKNADFALPAWTPAR
jgi:TolB protein